jgi:hypothetical protein
MRSSIIRILASFAFVLFASLTTPVRAQQPAEADVEASEPDTPAPAADASLPEHAPSAESAPPAATTPASPEAPLFQAVLAGVPIRLTGIVHAAIIGTQGVQTFGQPNASAATAALNPMLVASPDDPNLTFQIQQTRLGMIVGEGTELRAQVEIDFIHFDQASPTTQAYPRIRIAVLEWRFAENQRLFLGQTWDLFGNAIGPQLLSHSFNLVGTLFQAGNIGFMRQQLGYSGRFGDVELAAAVGLQGANTGPSFNNIEESFTPTGSARVMLHLGESSVIGVSALGTALRLTDPTMPLVNERRLALGGQVFADLTLGPLSIHGEVYIAQDLANLGALNLGQGRFGVDVADVGGYLSARLNLGQHAITAMFGGAAVLNPEDVVPGYTPADPMAASRVGTPNVPAGPGIEHNLSAHVGYWYSPLRGLSIVLEPYLYVTRFRHAPADEGRFDRDRVAFGAMLGSMFQF